MPILFMSEAFITSLRLLVSAMVRACFQSPLASAYFASLAVLLESPVRASPALRAVSALLSRLAIWVAGSGFCWGETWSAPCGERVVALPP